MLKAFSLEILAVHPTAWRGKKKGHAMPDLPIIVSLNYTLFYIQLAFSLNSLKLIICVIERQEKD